MIQKLKMLNLKYFEAFLLYLRRVKIDGKCWHEFDPFPDCKSPNKKEIWIFSTNLKILLFKITILRTKFYRNGEFSMTYSSIDYDIFLQGH